LWGGKPGEYGDYLLRLPGESEVRSMAGSHHLVPVNSEVVVRTGGGGGWGDPLDRDPAAVRMDVVEELVSKQSAEADYGVVLSGDLSVDEVATERTRNALRSGKAH
jgi:N-methylhydantoinase B